MALILYRVAPHYGRTSSSSAGSSTGSGSSSGSGQGSSGGDNSVDSSAAVASDAQHVVPIGDHIELRWKPPAVDEDSITMEVTLLGTGWSAIGIGSGMSVRMVNCTYIHAFAAFCVTDSMAVSFFMCLAGCRYHHHARGRWRP